MSSISLYTGLNRVNGHRISGKQHLVQSLNDVLTTPIGSRVMLRDYGSLLPFLVDQPMTGKTLMQMRAAIAHCIAKWEPRVILTSVFIKGSMYTGIDISLEYKTSEGNDNVLLGNMFND